MATETETTLASPFHTYLCLGRLCLDRLADCGPASSMAFTLGI